jgi:hypothetical protein
MGEVVVCVLGFVLGCVLVLVISARQAVHL